MNAAFEWAARQKISSAACFGATMISAFYPIFDRLRASKRLTRRVFFKRLARFCVRRGEA
ncbi:hypothetical protein CR492_10365 [Methylocella silvestris]|uniref:Uncharacterized protein n=1 Tax=Methylocella silvestris TaxID=199596 RepID=A0A2J7TGV0_METSI|nr:hypothetical protein CR492_10365 [Methylocella silvestris]